jgi:hypothetical protein
MEYMLLIGIDPSAQAKLTDEENQAVSGQYMEFTRTIAASGELVGGHALEEPETSTTLRLQGTEVVATDGPFAETHEVLGGYFVIDVPDLDRAIALASQIPAVSLGMGSVEVRPVRPMPAQVSS